MKKTELENFIDSRSIEQLTELSEQHGLPLSAIEKAALTVIPDIRHRLTEKMFPGLRRKSVEDMKQAKEEVTAPEAVVDATQEPEKTTATKHVEETETKSDRKKRQRELQINGYKGHKTRPRLKVEDRTELPSNHKVGREVKEDSKNNLRNTLNMWLEKKGFQVKAGRMSPETMNHKNKLIDEGINAGFLHKDTKQFKSTPKLVEAE